MFTIINKSVRMIINKIFSQNIFQIILNAKQILYVFPKSINKNMSVSQLSFRSGKTLWKGRALVSSVTTSVILKAFL